MPKKKGMPEKQPDKAHVMPMPSMPSPEEEKYKTERDFNTLMDAHEIKQDPERMKKVHAHASKKMGGIRSIKDLKDEYNRVAKDSDSDGM